MSEFEKIMEVMKKIDKKFGALRFGQILGNAIRGDMYYMTDKNIRVLLESYLEIFV